MSHKKEILDLESQAKQYIIKARELQDRAEGLRYSDLLSQLNLIVGDEVVYRGKSYHIVEGRGSNLLGALIKKDGTDGKVYSLYFYELSK